MQQYRYVYNGPGSLHGTNRIFLVEIRLNGKTVMCIKLQKLEIVVCSVVMCGDARRCVCTGLWSRLVSDGVVDTRLFGAVVILKTSGPVLRPAHRQIQ